MKAPKAPGLSLALVIRARSGQAACGKRKSFPFGQKKAGVLAPASRLCLELAGEPAASERANSEAAKENRFRSGKKRPEFWLRPLGCVWNWRANLPHPNGNDQ
jgi:hypothetical protein